MAVVITSTDRTTRTLSAELSTLKDRLDRVEAGIISPQLGDSSIQNGYISIYDEAGNSRARIGRQDDGTYVGGVSTNNPDPPPLPRAPTVVPVISGLRISSNGTASTQPWPADFLYCNVHVQQQPIDAPTTPMVVGTLPNDATSFIHAPLAAGSTWEVWLTAVNMSGRESPASASVIASPNQVVSSDVLAGAIDELALADGAVAEAKLAAGAVTVTKVADNAIESPKIAVGAVQAGNIAVGAVQAGHIAAGSITGREILALSITTDLLAANAVRAGNIEAGSITGSKLAADLIIANRIITGNPVGSRVELHPSNGIQAFLPDGVTRSVWIDSATGNMTAMGEWSTALTGERVKILTDGTMQFWQATGSNYSLLANQGSYLQFRGPLDGSNSGHLWMLSNAVAIAYGTLGGTVPGSFRCDGAGVQSWGRLVGIRYENRYTGDGTQPRLFILPTKSNGSDNGSGNLHFINRGGGDVESGATILAPGEGCGFALYGGAVAVVTGDPYGYGRITAAGFDSASSESVKEDIGEIEVPQARTSWDLVEGAPSLGWHYRFERPEDRGDVVTDPDTGYPLKLRKRRTHPDGSDVNGEGPDAYELVDYEYARPAPPRRRHRGPLAEDLLALDPGMVHPDPVGDPSSYVTDLRDLVGVLWDAVDMLIKRTRVLETRVSEHLPGLTLPPRPQRGDVAAGAGSLHAGRTLRNVDSDTHQVATRVHAERSRGERTAPASLVVESALAPPAPPRSGVSLYTFGGQLWAVTSNGERTRLT